MQKFIFLLAALAVGGLLIWYYAPSRGVPEEANNQEQTEEQTISQEPTVVISYTNEGYASSTVNIKKGETVRFMNDSTDQETWPASAVHPTHSIYPGKTDNDCLGSSFDACRGLKPGESWDFTFNEVGEWRFHDHIHAAKTGVVNVSE